MGEQEHLYQSEDPNSNRWARSIGVLLRQKATVEILSKEKDHPENNHPVRLQAKKLMQSLRPKEATGAAQLLLSGIGESKDNKQIKAAQFLFASLDFLKMDQRSLRTAFAAAATKDTPVENIRAVIRTGEIIIPDIPESDGLRLQNTLSGIRKHLPKAVTAKEPVSRTRNKKEFKPSPRPKTKSLPATETIFDDPILTPRDVRMIKAHNQDVPHGEIAENEGVSRSLVSTRLSRLRIKGVNIEKKANGVFESESIKRREIVKDCANQGMTDQQIVEELKRNSIDISYDNVKKYKSFLREKGELPPPQKKY
jgi:predicted DNA-binding protein YlxM (UPF0122 family)